MGFLFTDFSFCTNKTCVINKMQFHILFLRSIIIELTFDHYSVSAKHNLLSLKSAILQIENPKDTLTWYVIELSDAMLRALFSILYITVQLISQPISMFRLL